MGQSCEKGRKKAGEEEWRMAYTRRTPDEDEDEENCVMIVYMKC